MATAVLDPLITRYGAGTVVDFAAGPGASSRLLQMDKRVNRVFSIRHGKLPWPLNPAKRALRNASRHAPYDLVINLETSSKYDDFSRFLRYRQYLGRPLTAVLDEPDIHAVDMEKSVFRSVLGEELTRTAQPKLELIHAPEKPASRQVLLNPGFSGLASRNYRSYRAWPMEHWLTLASGLQQQGYSVMVNGTEAEGPILGPLLEMEQVGSLVGSSLEQLLAALKKSAGVVTVDTGTMHLAAALGTPVVALFGPTNPGRTGPYSRETPAHMMTSGIFCQPCVGTPRLKACSSNLCMQQLTPERVLDQLLRTLRTNEHSPAT